MLWVTSLYQIGKANEGKTLADRRRPYYDAYAHGMAASLDPNYNPGFPDDPLLRDAYLRGGLAVGRLSPIERQKMADELIMHGEKPPLSLYSFKNRHNGADYAKYIQGRLETPEYLTR